MRLPRTVGSGRGASHEGGAWAEAELVQAPARTLGKATRQSRLPEGTHYDLEAAPQQGEGFREPGRHRSLVAGHKPKRRPGRQHSEQARHAPLALEAHHGAAHDAGVQELPDHTVCEEVKRSHPMIVYDDRRPRTIPLDDGREQIDDRVEEWRADLPSGGGT